MAIHVECECGRRLKARDQYAGTRAECPTCGRVLQIPELPKPSPAPVLAGVGVAAGSRDSGFPPEPPPIPRSAPPTAAEQDDAVEISDFFDPPASSAAEEPPAPPVVQRMLEAALDPRSIQWMLMIGGGLAVLGLIVWLVSLGIFENPLVLAAAMGVGTLAVLGAGCYVSLGTRYHIAGQALTFLACVVAPLNLWFYHAQDLLVLDGGLWVGGLVCCLLYVATVYVLRDGAFLYAVTGGVTLTVLLFLAELGLAGDPAWLSLCLMALGLAAIHAERAFPPLGDFNRRRFGMPLFWSGQAQVAVSLLILLAVQLLGWFAAPVQAALEWKSAGNLLTPHFALAGGLWLAGVYAYLYSDLVVRRIGIYTLLAALCLVMAEITLIGTRLNAEGLIAVLALTALAANLVQSVLGAGNEKVSRAVPPLAFGLSALPVLIGVVLHLRATSRLAAELDWTIETGWPFAIAMLIVAAGNRVSAFVYRRTAPKWSAAYFFFSAAGLIVAAAGLLRVVGLTEWTQQAPLLMLIPIGYIVASRLWRGHSPERPLAWVGQAATAVILVHVAAASVEMIESALWAVQDRTQNLLLALVFAEAALFYALAAVFRRRSVNAYLAALAACGALWQLKVYLELSGTYGAMRFALLGAAFLIVGRLLGLEQVSVYRADGEQRTALRGRGLTVFQSGNAILWIALLAAFLQGLMRLASPGQAVEWARLIALSVTTLTSAAAIVIVPPGAWRRLYATAAVALAGVTFLTLNVLIDLSGWQKFEIFCIATGVLLLGAAHVGRFRETSDREDDLVTLGLLLGSMLATVPLFAALTWHRLAGDHVSLPDEMALLTLTIVMLVSGVVWKVRSTTLLGGGFLGLYLAVLIGSLVYRPQVAIGVYLAFGGSLVFACGIALSIYRDRLLRLPEQIANREGVFRVIAWR